MSDRRPGIRPRASLVRRLDISARLAVPVASTALLLLLLSAPLGLPGQAELQVAVALCCVFFWSLFRPGSMPPPTVFLLGLLGDLLGYAPPGVGVLSLLIVHGVALRWRRQLVRQGFGVVWLAFLGIAFGAAALAWIVTSLLEFRLLPPAAAMFQAVLTAGLYPPLAVLLTHAHQTVAEPDHA
ncbi:MAG: rod shape-determining protein MreD [Rhodospirillales bacterium]|nr:rod shape-determining protein MreD [Rhodospirillales bacterium]MDE2574215.1 rod shape-determining protein MreD [Rhodospirillales bacterium]